MILRPSVFVTLTWLSIATSTLAYSVALARNRQVPGRLGTSMALCSLVALSMGLIARGLETGHWPLSNGYEFSLAMLWAVLASYLILELATRTRAPGAFAMGMALLIGAYPQFLAPEWAREARPLLPALRTFWLQLHVTTAALAYGAFAVACSVSVMYLLFEPAFHGMENLPKPSIVEHFSHRAVTMGYPWMSLVLITGAIWAQLAWGRYWDWDIKETWTLATWLVYTLVLHLRVIRGWRGKPIAALTILGFALVLFTFLGVGWLAHGIGLQSLHLY